MKVSHRNTRTQGSASHNDRMFDIKRADHIDPDRIGDNRYWCIYDGIQFAEAEQRFYEENYRPMLDARNHKPGNKAISMEDFMKMPRYCPEELILQIGKVGDKAVDPSVFDVCFDQYMKQMDEWNRTHGSHMHVLNYAIHKDEATVHAHIRRVFDYTDRDGMQKIGLDRALLDAGVRLPEPGMPPGRRNNRKMEFDRMMKERWTEICEEHGIDVDRKPVKAWHQKIDEYKRDRCIEEADRSVTNIHMIGSIVERTLGGIPDEKRVDREDGSYVRLDAEEYERLRAASVRLAACKEEEATLNRELKAATERTDQTGAESRAMQDVYISIGKETQKLRQRIAEAGLLSAVEREGVRAVREPNAMELVVAGAQGKGYDHTRYASVKEAMDDLEQHYGTEGRTVRDPEQGITSRV